VISLKREFLGNSPRAGMLTFPTLTDMSSSCQSFYTKRFKRLDFSKHKKEVDKTRNLKERRG